MTAQPELPASDVDLIAAVNAENEARRALETAQARFDAAKRHTRAVLRTRGVLP